MSYAKQETMQKKRKTNKEIEQYFALSQRT